MSGKDLVDASFEGGLKEYVPESPGIYLWRRNFNAGTSIVGSKVEFIKWLEKVTSQPNAVIDATQITHCVQSAGYFVGGGGLTEEKQTSLDRLANNPKFRRMLQRYIETLSDFTPPIYIGEADSLLSRVKNHLSGDTNLQTYVEDKLGLSWKDLTFQFFVTSKHKKVTDDKKSKQELFELISQRLLAPFGTRRPG